MKRKAVWIGIVIVLIGIGISFASLIDRVTVSASSVALADQGWRASFSTGLHPDAIEKGQLYIADEKGEKLDTEIQLHPNGQTIEVPELSVGEYTLHIQKSAFTGFGWKALAHETFNFSVLEKLGAVNSEEDLRAYFAQLLELRNDAERYGAFSQNEAQEESSAADSSEGSGTGGGDHSTTNQQVEGVDEADVAKTDGSFIYSISDGKVVVSSVSDPGNLSAVSELTFDKEFYPTRLFLEDNTLIVLGDRYDRMPYAEGSEGGLFTSGITTAHLYDVSDPAAPERQREFGTDGYLTGARLTDGVLYVVTSVYADLWALEEDESAELRPQIYDSNGGEDPERLAYDRITILPGALESSYTLITALDLQDPAANEIVTEGFLGSGEQMYMNKEHLYLTTSVYMPLEEEDSSSDMAMDIWLPQVADTEIFKFALSGTAVDFIASGKVEGSLLNQFSMDEYDGHFRIVTTEGVMWEEASPSKNHLFILDAAMERVGSVEDLAPGERIYSARFMGDKAYMVTFRETDPLFVIDVADPAAPEVLGELKIPGFSNYLHPLGEDHLIGFGYDTKLEPAKGGGDPLVITGGMKISLFDVSDFHNPIEKDIEIIGGMGTYSPLHYDHKALFVHGERDLFGFPVTLYEESEENYVDFVGQGAVLFTITADGIEPAADLTMASDMPYEDWETSIQRLLYSGDALYTVANGEISSYSLDSFEAMDTLRFTE